MIHKPFTRREFIKTSAVATLGLASGSLFSSDEKPVVSIVKIENDQIEYAVEKAIDLIGGIQTVTKGRNSIMLKPNLVGESPTFTTKPAVVNALAKMMKSAGKEVVIGEGSAAAEGFNAKGITNYRTRRQDILDPMQQYVFDTLGYTELAESLNIPLINLHSGDLVDVDVPNGLLYDRITLHKSLTEVDMLCSVPMMKTHTLATVTLGMKNLIGLYPGTVYYSVRSWLHDRAAEKESPGVAFEILDMVRANKLDLVVVDGSMAMEGTGPTAGTLVKMDLIIAGTNPLATDLITANIMGFEPDEVPTFICAIQLGMTPTGIDGIEVRGEPIENVRRPFVKPIVFPWNNVSPFWGNQEL
ncbi:DUF362 domain-containing protein [bacterium]|nr:DUF362 domain-containing protein [bacterium]RQV95314.1 MAG: DUF362 domain-containing protein [bacterium]